MKPTYIYYFISMKCSLYVAMGLIPCEGKLIFVKSNIYIYHVFLIKIFRKLIVILHLVSLTENKLMLFVYVTSLKIF